ncbi:hypothetical protein [Flavobacterium sp. N1718]|uniref:hypothetical protein n=1 Tax=Flavobacterium sp. N1718 TaxID=2986822 RepID=UPI0022252AB0|nr:hypothetical protein [Flavobacterium sp. N1718]
MRNLCFLSIVFLMSISAKAQNIVFPDVALKNYLLSANAGNTIARGVNSYIDIDTNNDNEISVVEAQEVISLNLDNNFLSDFTGLQEFGNLTGLSIKSALLENLSLSNFPGLIYLGVRGTELKTVSLTNFPSLTNFVSQATYIHTLTFSGAPNVSTISMAYNFHTEGLPLLSLDLSSCPNLQQFLSANSDFGDLVFPNINTLKTIQLTESEVSSISWSGCNNLETLVTPVGAAVSADLTGLSLLQTLDLAGNNLQNVNLDQCPILRNLSLTGAFTSVDTSVLPLLESLKLVQVLNLTQLDLSQNENLKVLNIGQMGITDFTLTSCPLLTNLYISSCDLLTNIEVTNHENLYEVYLGNNPQLVSLNLSASPSLLRIRSTNGVLQSVNVSECPSLTQLNLANNQLTTIDVSSSPLLDELRVNGCPNLQSIFAKNGSIESTFTFGPSVQYICADEGQIAALQAVPANANIEINTYCTTVPAGTFYTMSGISRFDENAKRMRGRRRHFHKV